jgi:hypothetical protein
MYSQVDADGHHHLLLQELIDHRKLPTAMTKEDMWSISHKGNQTMKATTRGWEICVQWKDGSTSWERLCDIKESHPCQLAEYAVANQIENEPVFTW